MVSKIKETLQEQLVKKRYRWYQEQIAKQQLSYDEWIREKERQEREERQFLGKQYKLSVVSYDECRADFSFENYILIRILIFKIYLEGKNYIVIQLNELKSDMEITIQ